MKENGFKDLFDMIKKEKLGSLNKYMLLTDEKAYMHGGDYSEYAVMLLIAMDLIMQEKFENRENVINAIGQLSEEWGKWHV